MRSYKYSTHGDTLLIKVDGNDRLTNMEQCKVDAINDFLIRLYKGDPRYYIFRSLKSTIIVLHCFKSEVVEKYIEKPGVPLSKEYKEMLERVIVKYGSIAKWAKLPGNQVQKAVIQHVCSWIAKLSDGDVKLSDFEVLYLPFSPYVTYDLNDMLNSFDLSLSLSFSSYNFKEIGRLVDILLN